MEKVVTIGFYLENRDFPGVDLRFPEKGNPGIGGTQFSEIVTARYLSQLYPDQLKIVVFANLTDLLPSTIKVCSSRDVADAAIKSKQEGCDIFIFRTNLLNEELLKQLSRLKIKAIARSDNFPSTQELNGIVKCPEIKCHVCVGQEELDLYRDHRVFEKSIRIFNSVNVANYIPAKPIVKCSNTVAFLGSLYHSKGFHRLAKVWPDILRERPDAKLIVIGSSRLYDRNQQLGKWGIADEAYEANYIRPFLSDLEGNLIPSVHFVGLLGLEKIDILQNVDVGVANPTGETETFCISAVEIQACGTPVVSAAKGGLFDTVVHNKTGLLGTTDQELIKNILYLLNHPEVAKQFGKNGIHFVKEKFNYPLIAEQWFRLFRDLMEGAPIQPQPMKHNFFYNAKLYREIMRILKKNIPLLRMLPSLIEIKPLLKKKLKIGNYTG